MTRLQTFPLPDVGEGLTEAEILSWSVAEGDVLEVNQVMVEIETAKAAVELPSPYSGRVHRLLVQPGATIEVGTPIIQIDTEPEAGPLGDDEVPAAVAAGEAAVAAVESAAVSAAPAEAGAPDDLAGVGAKIGETTTDGRVATLVGFIPAGSTGVRRSRKGAAAQAQAQAAPAGPVVVRAPLATPPVRKLAKDLGVDLRSVVATRTDGVISRADVESVYAGGIAEVDGGVEALPTQPVISYDPATRENRVPVKGVRKMTAAAMVESAFTAPHVTEFVTADVTAMMRLREKLRARPEYADVRLSPLAFAARAVCLAARRTPEANSVWVGGIDGDAGEIVYKQYLHLGIAAATPRGLIVPVIRDADQLDLLGLARALGALAATARSGKTPPADMAGGTFTITNVGVFGVDTGTPIINPGQSAILALGSIKDAPWVVNGKLKVRKVCQLALSFDHRVIDGQQGSQFLADVAALLEDPGLALSY